MRSPLLAGSFAFPPRLARGVPTGFGATPVMLTVYTRKGQGMLEQVFTKR